MPSELYGKKILCTTEAEGKIMEQAATAAVPAGRGGFIPRGGYVQRGQARGGYVPRGGYQPRGGRGRVFISHHSHGGVYWTIDDGSNASDDDDASDGNANGHADGYELIIVY